MDIISNETIVQQLLAIDSWQTQFEDLAKGGNVADIDPLASVEEVGIQDSYCRGSSPKDTKFSNGTYAQKN
jgi:hypothetical protein